MRISRTFSCFLLGASALYMVVSGTSALAASYNPVFLGELRDLRDCTQDLCAEYQKDVAYTGRGDSEFRGLIEEIKCDAARLSKDLHGNKPLKEAEKNVRRLDGLMRELHKEAASVRVSRQTRAVLEETCVVYERFRRHYQYMAFPSPNEERSNK